MNDLFKLLGDPAAADKAFLGAKTDAYIDRILKLMQLMYYGKMSGQPDLAERVIKTYKPVIELLEEEMSKDIEEYTVKHGEL